MARIYKQDSFVHKDFQEIFALMEAKGISMTCYGHLRFNLNDPALMHREVEIVDEDLNPITTLPPFEEFKVKIFDSD